MFQLALKYQVPFVAILVCSNFALQRKISSFKQIFQVLKWYKTRSCTGRLHKPTQYFRVMPDARMVGVE